MTHLTPKALVILFFLFLQSFSLVVSVSLTADSEILTRVKKAKLGDPYGNLKDWGSNSEHNPCNWTGISCDSRKQSVVSIDLSSLNITGGFPFDFCRIPTLRNLSLGENNLTGIFSSDTLSLCSHLHVLNISWNIFFGELPEFWPEFTKLEILDLTYNNFTGNIPVSFGRFPVLKVLTLESMFNLQNGSIPSFLGNLSELTRLELAYTPFKPGPLPAEIGNLTKLENLFLSSTNLIGPIPDSIGKLVSLKNLDLSTNSLSGEIPDSIGGLKSIEQMELYDNQLSGKLPESIANLSTLLRLDVSQNSLIGTLSKKIAAMPLNSLNLNDNLFEGHVPEVLASNTKLQELKLFNNSFSGTLPETLGKFADLDDFDVSTNNFTGELPKYLCHNNKLQTLITFSNRFSGSLPDSYGACNSLSYVRIENNELSGEVPNGFWSLPALEHLDMKNNRFQGSISHSISPLLSRISISANSFTGEIPVEICQLNKLRVLDVSENQFSGELPTCITGLKMLEKISMQENMFSGEIPSSLSSWTDLAYLNLSRNRFSGTIPPELGNLPVLTYLDLSGNLLTGEIPVSLTKLKLNEFNLSDNNLYGKVPLGFNNDVYVSGLLGNPNLCSPTLKPLPSCSEPKHTTSYVVVVILAVFAVLLLVSLLWFLKAKFLAFGTKSKSPWKVIAFQRIEFNEEDLFPFLREENLIGTGGSGQVFKVKLKTGQIVAVKRLWGDTHNPDSEAVFRSEVEILGRIRHSNILKLIFCCSSEDCKILVYEYMENGSLGDVLHGEKGVGLFDWSSRFTIAVGAAQGLAYLHHDCEPSILHRDVKSNNILLDVELRPRVADFGLAKTLQREVVEGTPGQGDMSRIAGSYGYIAPEYGYTLRVTEKSDVYSFGVVLLELITGKRPNDSSFGDNKDIVKWVSEIALSSPEEGSDNGSSVCRDLGQLIDPMLDPFSCDYEEIEKVLNVALLCTSSLPINRPSMRKVVVLLQDKKLAHPK